MAAATADDAMGLSDAPDSQQVDAQAAKEEMAQEIQAETAAAIQKLSVEERLDLLRKSKALATALPFELQRQLVRIPTCSQDVSNQIDLCLIKCCCRI
jgi:hypothetical protein